MKKVVAYSRGALATVAPVGMSCWDSNYCTSGFTAGWD